MTAKVESLSVVGVFVPTGQIPGFAIPVFSPGGTALFVQQPGGAGRVAAFRPADIPNSLLHGLTRTVRRNVGDALLHAFVFSDAEIVVADAERLAEILRSKADRFGNRYFLQQAIAEFVGDLEWKQEAVDLAYEALARHNPEHAVLWWRSASPDEETRTAGVVFYLLHRLRHDPKLQVVIEPAQITPVARLVYGDRTAVEWVHCTTGEDEQFAFTDLKEIFEMRVSGRSLRELLASTPDSFYTLLVSGPVLRKIRQRLAPPRLEFPAQIAWSFQPIGEVFPPDLRIDRHFGDRWMDLAPPDVLWRVRLVELPPPELTKLLSSELLSQSFAVADPYAMETQRELVREIRVFSTAEHPRPRPIEFDRFGLTPLRDGLRGHWLNAREVLRNTHGLSDPQRGELPSYDDFEAETIYPRPEFDEAWTLLQVRGRVVVTGRLGTGKSSLARYVAFRYMQEHPEREVYFLSPSIDDDLARERAFLAGCIGRPGLFIIDDQQRAPRAVEDLLELLEGANDSQNPSILVVSTIKYTPTQAGTGRELESVLNDYAFVQVRSLNDPQEFGSFIDFLRFKPGFPLSTPLDNQKIRRLTQGMPGYAVLISRAAAAVAESPTRTVTGSSGSAWVIDWVLQEIGRPGDRAYFDQHCAMIFTVGAVGVPVTRRSGPAVEELHRARILVPADDTQFGVASSEPLFCSEHPNSP